ncbi:MAG TPA: trimeric intracellular cation channel family protein [Nitrolancea sp.]|nr:trimeric intracellular cation channel family protein [Nitrolancea sp.]
MHTLLVVLDLAGTFVFALSGAAAGVRKKLDLFGVLVLSFAAANVGGIIRDLLLGAVPPPAISNWRYIAVSLVAGLMMFYWSGSIHRWRSAVMVLDAAGLALFAVSGAQKALTFHLNPVAAILLGMLTGIGGGILRDMLVSEVPIVLRSDLYAVAALAGATVVVVGSLVHLPPGTTTIAGALVCFGLRMVAIRRGWQLPTPRQVLQAHEDTQPNPRVKKG